MFLAHGQSPAGATHAVGRIVFLSPDQSSTTEWAPSLFGVVAVGGSR